MPVNVKEELDLCKQEQSARAPWDSWWQSIKEVVDPQNAYITRTAIGIPADDMVRIHDTTVIESAEGLANMMTAQLTPAGQQFLIWTPTFEFDRDEQVIEWYAECSYRAMKLVNQSNFATLMAQVNNDRATVGTGMLLCYETGNRLAPFRFRHHPIGSYTFNEDLDGVADAIRIKFQATAAQLIKQFPKGKFGSNVNKALANAQERSTKKFTIWHIVKPREERTPGYMDSTNMPYMECYLCEEDQNCIEETGQYEFIGMVSRFQKGLDGSVWGVSPVRKAMPAIAQANFMQEQLDLLLDLQVNPRVLAEAGMVGEIDMRPGAKTLVRAGGLATTNGGVREWLTGGNYPLGKDRIADKQNQIRKLFYHGMWADLARVEKEMTAEEVRAIQNQSEMLFVGVNARFEADQNPMLGRRVFGICLRAGIFPPPPAQLIRDSPDGQTVPDPLVSFQTNLSRVLQRKVVENSDMFLTRLANIAQYDRDVLDEFDLAVHTRELARTFGFKGPFLRTKEQVAEILKNKVAAANAAAQQQQQYAAADLATKLPPSIQNKLMPGQ